MKSGWFGNLGLVNVPYKVSASEKSKNWHSVQGCFYKFLVEIIIAVMVTKKAN